MAQQEIFKQKTPEQLEREREAAKEVLLSSYLMYEDTIPESMKVRNEKKDKYSPNANEETKELMETMQADVIDRFVQLGYTREEFDKCLAERKAKLGKKSIKGNNKKILQEIMKKETERDEMREYIENLKKNSPTFVKENSNQETVPTVNNTPTVNRSDNDIEKYLNGENEEPVVKQEKVKVPETRSLEVEKEEIKKESSFGEMKQDINKKQMFGIVKLPSNGECYSHKKRELRVSYLTAYDENMIFSPNLYKEGEFLEHIAKTKVLDDINVEDLIQSDIEAIIIWLRGTGYGNEYPIVVTDPETEKEFETNVDLTQLKYKEFKLKGDENGYFDFTMPNSGDKIKFRFLTNRDEKFLKKLKIKESNKVRVMMLRKYSDELLDAINNNELVDDETQTRIRKEVEDIHEEIVSKYDELKDFSFTHELTDRLNLQTVSVNGITDRKFISDYIINLNIKDASEYRRFIIQNAPGVDYNVKVERPLSLGGGSIDTFLQLDQFIFVNI